MELRADDPSGSVMKRMGSSPPSPELLLPWIEFIAMAMASWASLLMDPNDMAPVVSLFIISSTGSTSSILTGVHGLKSKRPRIKCGFMFLLSTREVNSLYFL